MLLLHIDYQKRLKMCKKKYIREICLVEIKKGSTIQLKHLIPIYITEIFFNVDII